MPHGREHPLNIHLLLAPQRKMVQPFLRADIRKHRLDKLQTPAILLLAIGSIDLLDHLLTAALRFRLGLIDRNAQMFTLRLLLRKTLAAKRTIPAILLIRSIATLDAMPYTMLVYPETQQFPVGTPVTLCDLVRGKILHPKPFLLLFLRWFVARLVSEPGITLAEVAVRDGGVKLLILAGLEGSYHLK